MRYEKDYNHPTPEELARDVAEEAETRDLMAAEYEAERVADMVAELRAAGWTVEPPRSPARTEAARIKAEVRRRAVYGNGSEL